MGLDGLFFKSFINSFRRVDLVPMGMSYHVCSLVAVWSTLFGHYVLSLINDSINLATTHSPPCMVCPIHYRQNKILCNIKKVLYGCNIIFFFTTFFYFYNLLLFYSFNIFAFSIQSSYVYGQSHTLYAYIPCASFRSPHMHLTKLTTFFYGLLSGSTMP